MSGRVIKMARHDNTFCVEERNILDCLQLLRIYLVKNVAELLRMLHLLQLFGRLVELVYTQVLGSSRIHPAPVHYPEKITFFPYTP